jgi:hypothetical protein
MAAMEMTLSSRNPRASKNLRQLQHRLDRFVDCYNTVRPHQVAAGWVPDETLSG